MAEVEDILKLSPLQEGLLFHSLYAPGTGLYTEQRWCVVKGELDTELFRKAWTQVINRHRALRAEFHWEETDEPVQVIYDEVTVEWATNLDGEFEDFLEADRERGFELDRGPLIRFALFPRPDGDHYFVWTFHHLLMDGWGNGVLIREVFASYAAARRGEKISLPSAYDYGVFLNWLEDRPVEAEHAYWTDALKGFAEQVCLGRRLPESGYASRNFECSEAETLFLEETARENRLTLNTLVQGAWAMLLKAHTGKVDVLFGVTVSGRPPELLGVEQAIGLFINTVPARVSLAHETSGLEWLQDLQSEQRKREQFGYGKLMDLQAFTEVPAGTPLFESLLVFENYPISLEEALAGTESEFQLTEREGYERTNYPLTVVVIPGETLQVSFRYECEAFSEDFIKRLFTQLKRGMCALLEGLSEELSKIWSLPEDEAMRLSQMGNGERAEPEAATSLELFRREAERVAEKVALIVPDQNGLTYRELDERSGRLAAVLQKKRGIGRGDRVGIYLKRNERLLVALFAVWKCGSAYVPLDRDFPVERLRFMVEDAALALLIHEENDDEMEQVFGEQSVKKIALNSSLLGGDQAIEAWDVGAADAAYIIYTSGSTGTPKGVLITHGNLVNFLNGMSRALGLEEREVFLAVTTISFDISILELFWPLVSGASLVLAPSGAGRDGEALEKWIREYGVTTMQATPTTWRVLLENGQCPAVRVLCGGEALPYDLARDLCHYSEDVWNLYGPTETTIWSGALKLNSGNLASGSVPVGGVILNTQFEVRDEGGGIVPDGATGELWIGGSGVSPGYWKRPELTAEKFQKGFYATGDLVSWRDDGVLEFHGRQDGQIKFRGYRIEIGEIEIVLLSHAAIQEAVVVLHGGDESAMLVAFICADEEVEEEKLREWVRQQLPSYMVPTRCVPVSEFPLTPNRKVDRGVLQRIPIEGEGLSQHGGRWQSPEEELVAGIWSDVLGRAVTSRADHFFEMGGHSLAATRVVSRLRELLGREVPLRRLFERPVLSEFVSALDPESEGQLETIPRWEGGPLLPLSAAQRRQWLMDHLVGEENLYSVPTVVRIEGELSISRLQKAWRAVLAAHEELRFFFVEEDEMPFAQVARVAEGESDTIQVRDLSELEPDDQEKRWRELVAEDLRIGFDLSEAPLWRAQLFQLSAEAQVLLLNFHHILVDGWSLGLLVKELSKAYETGTLDQGERRLRYVDYSYWQSMQDRSKGLNFWQNKLAGLPAQIALPLDFTRPAEFSHEGVTDELEINESTYQALVELGRSEGTTLFMTLATAFSVLLYRYGAGHDFGIGTPIANRPRQDLEEVIGLFVNTLVLRPDLGGNPTLRDLLLQMRDETLALYQHQEVPFENVVERVGAPRSRASSPLFQVLFTLQNAPLEKLTLTGLQWSPITLDHGLSKFDLSLAMAEKEGVLSARWEYRSDLFSPETISQIGRDFACLLENFSRLLEQPLSAIPIHDRSVEDELITLGKGGVGKAEGTITEQFSQKVREQPNAVALISGVRKVSYKELDLLSQRWADLLVERGVGQESRVGVMAVRSIETMAAIIGVLKAGGLYVPLEVDLPAARLDWTLRDAEIGWVLSDDRLLLEERFSGSAISSFGNGEGFYLSLSENPQKERKAVEADQLAYLLYTSGSTGLPKGVEVPHRAVVRLVKETSYASFRPEDVFLQAAPLGFDASTFETWGPLLNGGTLVLAGRATPSLDELAELVQEHGVTSLWLTAGLFHLAVEERMTGFSVLRQLLAGGDALSPEHLKMAAELWPETQLINGYGPTEGTTFTCCHHFSKRELFDLKKTPIGRPIHETQVYILDADLQLVPQGAEGELYLGGQGLARGYANQASLTAEVFVPNPFFDPRSDELRDADLTLYRTRDRVRWRRDGVLEFFGRMDHQVKVRGFRIEPGEVEQALLKIGGVRETAVLALDDESGHKRLVAYVVGEEKDWKSDLVRVLPPHLVPSVFVTIPALPLTSNGKLERSALPAPVWVQRASSGEDGQGSEVEERVREVWQSVLPVESVGLYDNFFELGGDSILALQIVSRLKRSMMDVSPAELFKHQTVSELAAVISEGQVILDESLTEPSGAPFIAPPIQRWFRELGMESPQHFNQAISLRSTTALDRGLLEEAWSAVVEYHDALRMCWIGNELKIAPFEKPRIEWFPPEAFEAEVAALQESFALEDVPLIKFAASVEADSKIRLCLIAHHTVIDAVSWRILLDDLQLVYQQMERGEHTYLPAKTMSYEAWAKLLPSSVEWSKEDTRYWQGVVQDSQTLSLKKGEGEGSQEIEFKLDGCEVDLPILLASAGRALSALCEGDRVTVMLESHGRDFQGLEESPDLSRTVGWMTAVYPFVLRNLEENDFWELCQEIEDDLAQVPHGGVSYGILRYLEEESSLQISPSLGFNFLGRVDAGFKGGGFERNKVPGRTVARNNRPAYPILINCWLEDNTLKGEWIFDPRFSKREEVAEILEEFLEQLKGADDPLSENLYGLDEGQLADIAGQVDFGFEDDE